MDVIERLINGYHRFRGGYYAAHHEKLKALAHQGQSPAVCVVSCSDSRVDPSFILDCEPGELFVIRNVANLVPPYETAGLYHGTSAAIEFAVCGLQVSHVIVLGHGHCGGIQALLDGKTSYYPSAGFVSAWMSIAAAARARALKRDDLASPQERARACEQASIKLSLENLMTFPWISEPVAQGTLRLHGWYYDLDQGELLCLDPATEQFTSVAASRA
jgi:carbonic anhydrase